MDWEKAKKTFIYLLILLNVVLLGLNYIEGTKYKMTQSEEAAVYKVLSSNGIGIYCDLIKKNKPMRSLSVSAAGTDPEIFKKIFFDENEDVQTILEFDRIVLKSNDKKLETDDNNIEFYCDVGTGKIENFGIQSAKEAAEKFAQNMNLNGKNKISLEKTYKNGENYVFEFDEEYSGYKIFSNRKKIEVSEKGIVYAQASYYNVESFTGDKREICRCDEALLTVMYKIMSEKNSVGRYIENIELGYDFQNSSEGYDQGTIRLVPCYMVYVSGIDKPYSVNAYTNEIIENAQ